MALILRKKIHVEYDDNGTILAVGREEYNFVDNNGNKVYKFELYGSQDWISTNPTTFNGRALAPSQIVVCWDNWVCSIFNGTDWIAG